MPTIDPNARPPGLAVGTMSAALGAGIVLGVLTADDAEGSWPPQAAQVLVTLLVAAVLEQYTLPRKAIGWVGVTLALTIAVTLLIALAMCVVAASTSDGFTALESGVVNGALFGLGVIVVFGLLWRVWP